MKHLTSLLFAFVFFTFPQAQIQLLPKNEVYKDSTFTDFICKFQYAIFNKDKQFLLACLDKNIQNSFGDDAGVENFKQYWNLDVKSKETNEVVLGDDSIWDLLSKLISLGASYSSNTSGTFFTFPAIFTMDIPNDTLDVYETCVITAKNVNVREKPSTKSKILNKLSYEVVTYDYEKPMVSKDWTFVSSIDKKINGYVNNEFLWILVSYRMCFMKKDNEWKMIFLLAGD